MPLGLELRKTIKQRLARNNLNLPKRNKIILFFGNIRYYKGLDVLISSLEKINNKNIILLIAGQCWDKKLLELLKDKDWIIYTKGFIPEKTKSDYFSVCDLVILPYKYFDASSAAGADALSYGKPLVVTNVGGLPELVRDKRVIAKPNDAKDLKDKVIYALKNIKKLERDSKEMAKKFSWDKIAKKTLEVYKG